MSEWDEYAVVPRKSKPISEWDEYAIVPKKKIKQGDSWPELFGKSAFKGLSSVTDLPSVAAKTAEKAVNLGRSTRGNPAEVYWAAQNPYNKNIPKIETIENAPQTNYSEYVPSSEHVKSAVKNYTDYDLEPHPDSPAQNIVSKGVEFGTSMTPWALGGKGLTLANRFKNAAKATKQATAVGLGSGALQESGVNPLAADLVSSVVTPNIKPPSFRDTLKIPKKTAMKIMGLGPKRLNIEAAQAARDLGIDLPAAALTDSTLTGLADQAIGKTPIFGNVLKDKYNQVQNKTHEHLENIYNEIGPIRTPEVSKKITDLYELEKKALPTEAFTIPTATAKKINDINDSFYAAFSSEGRSKLKNYIQKFKKDIEPTLNSKYGNISSNEKIKIPLQPYDIRKLIDSKIMINDIVNHDVKGEAINRLMEINHGISEDIARYGKSNPDWYKKFKEADKFFASVAKREKAEKLLRNQATIGDPEELSYAALNRTINDNNTARLLRKNTPPETFEKIKKLGIVAKAMVQKNRRVPNPSGTAATAGALGLLSGVIFDPSSILTTGSSLGLISAAGATKLLTDKKFLDLALHYAETQSKDKIPTALKLNKRAKEITGYTLNSIYQSYLRNMNKEGIDGLQ